MSDLCLLSPLKRKFIENWINEVTRSYADGSICRVVLSSIPYDPDDREECARPNERTLPDKIIRISTHDKHKKHVDFTTSNNSQVQQLPAVTFSYIHVDKHKKQDNGAVPMFGYEMYNDKNRDKNDQRDDNKRFIIVDPQMINPSSQTAVVRKSVIKQHENDSPQTRVNRESSFSLKKESKDFYTKCKLHSSNKNGFVISRSNFRNQGTWKNHSFLDLPLRFRHDSQKATRASQLTIHSKEATPSAQQKADGNNTSRRIDSHNPKMITTAVWAW
ncbi:uncharacterized protein LOC110448864 [Mizuhopecten yessoensis]|uniref:Uncharacterized protein n=1 Tax=Mizuhopecten yessoensis TaxID=6573 RepID=A0A210QSF3_MIZYE|nr:uncharacterized protein LOC110448864 [Mizuhopecten yessoensis]XP_021351015.1 uncharacterized protein LOC110448864 [Mizuhopecten yessoensis]OWF51655.1 hypothetical protein KP79_PYT11718 [Mizuhopecten yessoensis]